MDLGGDGKVDWAGRHAPVYEVTGLHCEVEMPEQEIAPGITVWSEVRFGRPVVKGTRVPVETVVTRVAGGMSALEVAEEYGLTLEDVQNALRYAAQLVAEELVIVTV